MDRCQIYNINNNNINNNIIIIKSISNVCVYGTTLKAAEHSSGKYHHTDEYFSLIIN